MWKQNFFFPVEQKWMNNVSDVLNDSSIKFCTKNTVSSLINSQTMKKGLARMMNVQMGFKLYCCLSKKNCMFAHFVSFNFTRFGRQTEYRTEQNAACWDVKRNKFNFFYRVSIWRMNVYRTRVMLNAYFFVFFVDNCCIFRYFHTSIKDSHGKKSAIEKVSHKLRLHNPIDSFPCVDIRNSIELTAHIHRSTNGIV